MNLYYVRPWISLLELGFSLLWEARWCELSWLATFLSFHLTLESEKNFWLVRESNPGELAVHYTVASSASLTLANMKKTNNSFREKRVTRSPGYEPTKIQLTMLWHEAIKPRASQFFFRLIPEPKCVTKTGKKILTQKMRNLKIGKTIFIRMIRKTGNELLLWHIFRLPVRNETFRFEQIKKITLMSLRSWPLSSFSPGLAKISNSSFQRSSFGAPVCPAVNRSWVLIPPSTGLFHFSSFLYLCLSGVCH